MACRYAAGPVTVWATVSRAGNGITDDGINVAAEGSRSDTLIASAVRTSAGEVNR